MVMYRNVWAEMFIRPYSAQCETVGSRALPRKHPSFLSSGTVWIWLTKESCFPAYRFLAPSWGAWQSWASRGSPRHAGEPMTWWYVPSTGLLGPARMGRGKAEPSGQSHSASVSVAIFLQGKGSQCQKTTVFSAHVRCACARTHRHGVTECQG